MKRSTQVSLAVMTAAGIGGAAYALQPQDRCPAPSANAGDQPQDCRGPSRGTSGGGRAAWFFGSGTGSSGSGAGATATSSSASAGTARGGFGASGAAAGSRGG